MIRTALAMVGMILLAASGGRAVAQARRWVPIAELPARPTAIEIIDDSTTLIGTATPSLILMRGHAVIWEMRLDTARLPYFDYPHGMIVDILPISGTRALLAFQFGHARSVDLIARTTDEIPLRPINAFARSGDGTIVAGSRYRSTDDGASWDTLSASGLPADPFLALAGGPGARFYATPEFSGLWRSIDGGVTWTERERLRTDDSLTGAGAPLFVFGERTVVVSAADNRTLEGRKSALYKTTDDGESWRAVLPIHAIHSGTMYAYDAERAFAGVEDSANGFHIYVSSDEGDSWAAVDEGLPRSARSGVMAVNGTTVLAYVRENGPETLYRLEEASAVGESRRSAAALLSLFPNPATSSRDVRIQQREAFEGVLIVTDIRGNIVARRLTGTASVQAMGLPTLPPGLYLVELRSRDMVARATLVIAD